MDVLGRRHQPPYENVACCPLALRKYCVKKRNSVELQNKNCGSKTIAKIDSFNMHFSQFELPQILALALGEINTMDGS
jgi:hypothetical protein